VHPWRASRHYYPIKAHILDVVFYQILAGIRTHILIISGDFDMGEGLSKCPYLLDIYRRCNVDPTMTDINADLHLFSVIRDS
jgi:hypothetical protein